MLSRTANNLYWLSRYMERAENFARTLEVAPSTLSSHLGILERAGLLQSWRVQRQIFYAADYGGVRDLLAFLTEDCCQGRPEICAPVAAGLAAPDTPRRETGASR